MALNAITKKFTLNDRFYLGTMLLWYVVVLGVMAAGYHATSTPPDSIHGLWYGVWHGLIAFPAFAASLFVDSVAIYQTPNNGGWYDCGFLFGVALSATLSQQRRTMKRYHAGRG